MQNQVEFKSSLQLLLRCICEYDTGGLREARDSETDATYVFGVVLFSDKRG